MDNVIVFLQRLLNARAAISALTVTALTLVGASGFNLPSGFDDAAKHWLEALFAFLGTLVTVGLALHREPPPPTAAMTRLAAKKSVATATGTVLLLLLFAVGLLTAAQCNPPGYPDEPTPCTDELGGYCPASLPVCCNGGCCVRPYDPDFAPKPRIYR